MFQQGLDASIVSPHDESTAGPKEEQELKAWPKIMLFTLKRDSK
jgi:hypothetical protein